MNKLEFLSFSLTPKEKYIGIAAIRIDKRFICRYKIQQNLKGEGYFSNAPSVKIEDQYYPAFALDSSYEADEIKKFVMSNVKLALQNNSSFTLTTTDFDAPNPHVQQQSFFDQPQF